MPQVNGDLTLRIILESIGAEKNAKQFAATLTNVEEVSRKVSSSVVDLSDRSAKLGFALNATREVGYALSTSLRTVFTVIRESNEAYQQFLSSQRQLDAASKLTGANLDNLKKIAAATKQQFSLSSTQSGLFTIELTKLGQKAGDISKVSESIESLLDLGAGQGLDTEQTLYAIKQSILGIDEGTDKLFQKNPSVLYQEYAQKIGTTAGKLNDQQKSQALLNAVLESGGKLTGKYSEYLSTTAGKQQQLNNKINDAKIKLGEQLQPILISVVGTLNKLLTAFNSLDKGTQTFIVTTGVLAITVGKLLPLLGSLASTFPGIGSAATKAGGSIARVFGAGGPVVIAIALALWWASELFDKINDAKDEAAQLEQYQKRLSEGTFIPMYESNSPSDQTIKQYEKLLEKDPTQKIKVDGKDQDLKTYVDDLKKLNQEAKQYGKTWEEMTGQVKANVQDQKRSLKEVGDEVQKLNEQLQNMKPDDPTLKSVKEQRDNLKSEYDKINETINPSEKSKGGSRTKDVKEVTNEITDLQKQIDSLNEKLNITTPGTALFQQYENEIRNLTSQILFLNSTIEELKKINSEPVSIKGKSGNEPIEPVEDEILKFKIAIQEQQAARKEMEESFNSLFLKLSAAYNLVSAISSKLSDGGKDFWFWLQAALQAAIKITELVNKGNSKEGIGFGDVLGVIGTILPFFLAKGGEVPGSGTDDTVPAMLTPGEFVINKEAVSRIGVGTLRMLNGGALSIPHGLRHASPSNYRSGGNIEIFAQGELTDAISFKVVDKGTRSRSVKINRSTFPK